MSFLGGKLNRLGAGTATALGLAFFICSALYVHNRPDPNRVDEEQYSVYTAYLVAGLTGESHALGSRKGLVVILQCTSVSDMFVNKGKIGEYSVLLGRLHRARQNLSVASRSSVINLLVANLRAEQLQRHFNLPAQYSLALSSDALAYYQGGKPSFQERFPHNYGYHTFSRIGFNRDLTEALFYTEHICGLCGEGKFVYMRKVDGRWVVLAESGTWIS